MASGIANFRNKRWSFLAISWLLFIAQVHLYFKGLFMTKRELENKAVAPKT